MYVVIIGCGRIGGTLALELSNEGHDVVIIDKEKTRLEMLGSGFNGTRLRGVEFDHDVLLEAGIEMADVFLAMTPDDNVNLMAAQVARRIFNVKRVIARVCEPQKQFLYDQLALETICPTSSASQMVKEMIFHENYLLLSRINQDLEIIEFVYASDKALSVGDVNDKFHAIVLGITRNQKVQLAKDSTILLSGDRLAVSVMKSDRDTLLKGLGR